MTTILCRACSLHRVVKDGELCPSCVDDRARLVVA